MVLPARRPVLAGALLALVCGLRPALAAKALLWNAAQEPIWVLGPQGRPIHDAPAEPGTAIPIEPPDDAPPSWELRVVDRTWTPQRHALLTCTRVQGPERMDPPCLLMHY